ncbi:MAG: hypothetical protein FJ296_11570 [Planctomycetes bacterium]|nr:hypothetical protein [Planctomycetota bacterium]
MTAPAQPAHTAPTATPAPPGSRAEQALLALKLLLDLLSTPLHLLAFLFTRSRHRRDLRRALEESAP